jgi:glycosyltransferase involved in cell wall biosynthesis
MTSVLHVVPSTPFGGMQRIAALLAREQRRAGIDAQVMGIYDDTNFSRLLEQFHIPHVFAEGGRPGARSIRQLYRVSSRDWSIVHIHGGLLWSNLVSLLARRSPVVYHAHNYPGHDRSAKGRLLGRINRSLASIVIAVSDDVAREWRTLVPNLVIERVYNAIDLPQDKRRSRSVRSSQSPVFGMMTRFAKDKGVYEFLDVAEELYRRRPTARFVLAGDGPEKNRLVNEIAHRSLDGAFSLPGHVSDIDVFWSAVDFALFTARKEPFGLRILEPMVRGVPVAAYLTGAGSDEIFRSQSPAITAVYGDAGSLAERVLTVCDNPILYDQVADEALADVSGRFSVPKVAEAVSQIYARTILKPHRKSR